MKIVGRRADGALYLAMGGGLAVILKGERVTPTLDESEVERMGPWEPTDNSFEVRRTTQRALDLARVAGMDHFDLKQTEWFKKFMASKEKTMKPAGDAPVAVADVEESAPADEKKKPTKKKDEAIIIPAPEDIAVIPDPEKEETAPAPPVDPKALAMPVPKPVSKPTVGTAVTALKNARFDTYEKLLLTMAGNPVIELADKGGEHPFTYCKEHIVPAMAEKGNAPDDPDAFCAWWKAEKA